MAEIRNQGKQRGGGADRRGWGSEVLAWALLPLGLVMAVMAISVSAYALSGNPDTGRGTLGESSLGLLLAASMCSAVAATVVRTSKPARRVTDQRGLLWAVTFTSLAVAAATVAQVAGTWGDPHSRLLVFIGGAALSVFLLTLALRMVALPVAAALALSGFLAVVAETL